MLAHDARCTDGEMSLDGEQAALAASGVELGRTYPRPIVSHLISRELALEAYQAIRRAPRNANRR